ncbi:MAG: HNH endonuclease signature motif containing protein [Elusimicrobia bacterium]|nr:HNH endonuclease signature motif containing protein [Elusimicrobiota bacterium]
MPGTACPPKPPGASLYDRIEPTAPDRVRFSFTGDEALLRKVERAQAILWHKHPAGKLEDIFAEALDFLLDKKDPERRLARQKRLKRKPPTSAADTEPRRIPQWVKDEVWARDAGQCVFVPPGGARCPEREGLEFDHIMPWALGGRSFDPRNIRLLCREHNQMRARRMFGEAKGRRV